MFVLGSDRPYRSPRQISWSSRLGACQCKTCRSWLGIEGDWTTEQFEALQACVVFGSFAACQDTTVSLRPDFIRWHAFPYVSWMWWSPPSVLDA